MRRLAIAPPALIPAQANRQEVQAADALGLEVCGQNGTNGV
jgi:hypothetical protein